MSRLSFTAALACIFNVASASEVTPIEKVTTMLTDLQTQVNDEGNAEAKTYDSFACFCKTTMADKSKAISEGKTDKNSLASRINADMEARDKEDINIAEKLKTVKELNEDIDALKSDRKSTRLTFEQNEEDLTSAIHGIDSAILSMKAAKTAIGFTQLPPAVKSALVMAQVLLPKRTTQVAALLQNDPNEEYAFHSESVVTTLEELKTDFKKERDDVQKAEETSKSEYKTTLQNKDKGVKDATDAIETSKKDKAEATGRIASASEDLTSVSAKLLDDQTYLQDLSGKCNEKAVLWDKRTQARAAELGAITQAITLIKSLKKEDDKAALVQKGSTAPQPETFLQMTSVRKYTKLYGAMHRLTHESAVKVHAQTQATAQLVQEFDSIARLEIEALAAPQLGGRKARAMALLRTQAQTLHSTMLDSLVSQAAADPLAKVKKMIQELIERLLEEAAQEASHKGFCDKEYAMTFMSRDKSSNELEELNALLQQGEARREKLGEEISVLDGELKTLEDDLAKGKKIRDEEKVENKKAIDDANEGKKIVEQAIDVLDKYYKTAANDAKSALLQISAEPEAPDAGFDEEYAGAQDGAVGVLGMLDVVKSDFERDAKETAEEEEQSAKAWYDQEMSMGISKAKKAEVLKSTTSAKKEADKDYSDNSAKLTKSQDTLDKALKEIASIDKACRVGGTTAEERKIQRDEEMGALNKALTILDPRNGM